MARVDFENRQIVAAIDAEHFGVILLLIRKRHLKLARAGDHVLIRHDFAVLVDDEPGTHAFAGIPVKHVRADITTLVIFTVARWLVL